ncbi:3-oxoadipate enol-lactonase [Erwinia sp. ErVv1]|uniref:3-oxoadipate enol-lactonase n=1 Tax=Erwinia sp. ErVv1 TaxID=1603299 RepID=UPI000B300E1D|nr:3-oxoadipate enol-lactonase [Erwinia sp. ErVv1]
METEYRLDGPVNAPVLVLSNSLGTLWTLWDAQLSSFIKHFRVLRYHTRGHGSSTLPADPLSIDRLGQDVIDLLDRLRIERACFCGISLGGLTGMWLNLHHPDRFDRFVLANTAARIGSQAAWQTRAAQVRREGLGTVVAATDKRWFTEDYIQRRPGIVENLLESLAEISPAGYAACCEALALADLRSGLVDMPRPMLMIAGREDPVTPVADAQRVVDAAPQARLCVLAASHLSNIACAPAFTRQTLKFLLKGEGYGIND